MSAPPPQTRPEVALGRAPPWSIREAGVDDADALSLVGAATFLETFSGVLDGLAIVRHCHKAHSPLAYRTLLKSGARAWLAELAPGNAPIGFALTSEPDLPGQKAADLELRRIYVLSRFHGAGPGGALMEAVISAAQTAKASWLLLGVYAGNTRALAFYERCGFRQIAERRFDVGGVGYDDRVLARTL